MREILERLGEVERVNTKLKKKDEDKFTFTKVGCENQFKFNNKIKDIAIDRMKMELQEALQDAAFQDRRAHQGR